MPRGSRANLRATFAVALRHRWQLRSDIKRGARRASRHSAVIWLAGERDARRRVPTAIGLGTNLIGTDDQVLDRLRLYRDAGITTLRASFSGPSDDRLEHQLHDLGRVLELLQEVNLEAPGPL